MTPLPASVVFDFRVDVSPDFLPLYQAIGVCGRWPPDVVVGLGSVAMRIIAFNNLSEADYKIVSLNAYN